MGTEEPPGRCFPARCGAAWGGYGAAWAAWCAPSRCPRTVRAGNRAFRVFTKHETRNPAFFRITAFLPSRQTADTRRRQARRLQGGCTKRGKTNGKEFFLNPETGITTYTESGFGSRFGIPHYSSVFVAKIRISPCRQSSASEHCGNRDIGFMDVSSPRLTFPGPQVSPSGEAKGERATNRETRPLTRRAAQAGANSEVVHETRDTKHESRLFWVRNTETFSRITALTAVRVAMGAEGSHHEKLPHRSLLSCALWRGMGRLWRGMGGMGRPEQLSAHHPHQQQGHSGFHETRDPNHKEKSCIWVLKPFSHFFPSRAAWHEDSEAQSVRVTNQGFQGFTNHYPLSTIHGLYAFLPSHDFPAFPAILRPPLPRSRCQRPVCRFRRASRRAPFAGNPGKVHKIPFAVDRTASPFARLPSHSGLLPPRRTPKESMQRKPTLYIAQTGNVLYFVGISGRTGRMDRMIRCFSIVPRTREGIGAWRLHFSPCGEAKCVRGLSGGGASRRKFRGFHETRITKHESRLLCFSRITAFD